MTSPTELKAIQRLVSACFLALLVLGCTSAIPRIDPKANPAMSEEEHLAMYSLRPRFKEEIWITLTEFIDRFEG